MHTSQIIFAKIQHIIENWKSKVEKLKNERRKRRTKSEKRRSTKHEMYIQNANLKVENYHTVTQEAIILPHLKARKKRKINNSKFKIKSVCVFFACWWCWWCWWRKALPYSGGLRILPQNGPLPMQLVVVMAVRAAVIAATMTFRITSHTFLLFISSSVLRFDTDWMHSL